MTSQIVHAWPALTTEGFAASRSGLHAFAKLLGAYASACAPECKHWWHVSLKPVIDGFGTGVLHSNGHLFELVLNFHSLTIQLWPHHFDLAMLVLTGRKIPGQNPENEELSDEQLNFGFVPGDGGIREPYFYITLYAHSERLAKVSLPDEAYFHKEGWSGIVMRYDSFRKNLQSETMLLSLWQTAWELASEEIL